MKHNVNVIISTIRKVLTILIITVFCFTKATAQEWFATLISFKIESIDNKLVTISDVINDDYVINFCLDDPAATYRTGWYDKESERFYLTIISYHYETPRGYIEILSKKDTMLINTSKLIFKDFKPSFYYETRCASFNANFKPGNYVIDTILHNEINSEKEYQKLKLAEFKEEYITSTDRKHCKCLYEYPDLYEIKDSLIYIRGTNIEYHYYFKTFLSGNMFPEPIISYDKSKNLYEVKWYKLMKHGPKQLIRTGYY